MFKFNLGDEVEDNITAFGGVVVARIEYLNGCIRYEVQPKKLKDGKAIETAFIDETQLKIIKKTLIPKEIKRTGGSRTAPPKLSVPK